MMPRHLPVEEAERLAFLLPDVLREIRRRIRRSRHDAEGLSPRSGETRDALEARRGR